MAHVSTTQFLNVTQTMTISWLLSLFLKDTNSCHHRIPWLPLGQIPRVAGKFEICRTLELLLCRTQQAELSGRAGGIKLRMLALSYRLLKFLNLHVKFQGLSGHVFITSDIIAEFSQPLSQVTNPSSYLSDLSGSPLVSFQY